MVLTKNTPQITPRKKHRPAPVIPLDARLLAAMRRDHVDLGRLRPDQTHARLLEPVDSAPPRTEVAVAQVRVRQRPLLGCVNRCQQLVPRHVVIQEEGRRNPQEAFGCPLDRA